MEIGRRFQDSDDPFGDHAIADAVASMHAAIDEVRKLQLDATDDALLELVPALEQVARCHRSLQLDAVEGVASRGLHKRDGHGSPKIFERHANELSNAEAAVRDKTRRMIRTLPLVRHAYEAGEIGTAHVDLLGRIHANKRVREAMVERQATFLADAARMSYRQFELHVRQWERLADQDGPGPAADRTHTNRDFRLLQEFNTSWTASGSFGSTQGAIIKDIFDHYVEAELLADWEAARAEHGDAATDDHLPRTAAQRRADAFERIMCDAAAYQGSPVPANTVHTVIWSAEAFEEMVRRLDPGYRPVPHDPDGFRCETIDGDPLDPNDAFAHALVSKFRRAVVDAKGVTIDLGAARLFTGSARAAVQLHNSTCVWPGCAVTTSRCQIDHLKAHSDGGRTHPGNGAPLCGRHNRLKTTRNYRVYKDTDDTWHIHTPDGRHIS